MLYDKDICEIEIKHGRVYLEYFCPTEEAVFTREDLVFLLEKLDEGGKVCKHPRMKTETIMDVANQGCWVTHVCPDCLYANTEKYGRY